MGYVRKALEAYTVDVGMDSKDNDAMKVSELYDDKLIYNHSSHSPSVHLFVHIAWNANSSSNF